MKLLKRWLSLRHRLQARYWKRRALDAEALLSAEMLRNREREDVFVSASILGAKGMFGLPPRTSPAVVPRHAQPPIITPRSQWEQMTTAADRMEFEQFWRADAEAAGVPLPEARAQFIQVVANRKALVDEPSN